MPARSSILNPTEIGERMWEIMQEENRQPGTNMEQRARCFAGGTGGFLCTQYKCGEKGRCMKDIP